VVCNLPAFGPAQVQHSAQHIATTIGWLTTQQCIMLEKVAQAGAARENHTIESCFHLNTHYLLCYCQIQTVDELPILWAEVAHADKT